MNHALKHTAKSGVFPQAMNIASPQHKANPFQYYARLRAESPVHRVVLPHKQSAWLITRYDDVAMVLKDQRFAKSNSSAKQPWVPGFVRPLTRNMLDLDEPDHTRLRTLVAVATDSLRLRRGPMLRGLESLPVAVEWD